MTNNILVIGDIILDQYIDGQCVKISPEKPVPILEYANNFYKLGGAANVTANLFSIGANVELMSIIGNDESSRLVQSKLKNKKIKNTLLKINDFFISKKTRVISGQHQFLRIDYEKKNYMLKKKDTIRFLNILKKKINSINIIIISDYGKGCLSIELLQKIILLAKKKRIKVFVDPSKNTNNYIGYKNAYCIKPNNIELEKFASLYIKKKKDNKDKIKVMKKLLNCNMILLTMGEDGMLLFDKNKFRYIKKHVKNVFDVTGAGDTVISVFVFLYAIGYSSLISAQIANICASKVIEKFLSVKESGIWNVGTGIATSFEDIAKYIGKKTQSKIVHIPMPINLKNHYQVYTKSNNKKLINSLGKIDFIKPYDWIDIKLKS